MFQKSTQSDTEQQLKGYIHSAGYKYPTLLQKTVLPLTMQGRDLVVESGPGEGRTGLFIISLLMHIESGTSGLRSLILTSSESEVHKVMRQFRRFSAKSLDKPHIVGLGTEENIHKESRLLARRPGIVVGTTERLIDHIRRENLSLTDVRQVVLVPPDDMEITGFDKDVLFIFSKLSGKYQTQMYTGRLEAVAALTGMLRRPIQVTKAEWCQADTESANRPKEDSSQMSEARDNKAQIDHIKAILKQIKEGESPAELNMIRRVFRRSVPLHLRAYVSAYLLKESMQAGATPTGNLSTLFVSIGKNRKVFPKDLSRFFSQELSLRSGDIGNIKILDNYSFIEISETHAQRAIDKLNDIEFRGRKITVNFARKKEEKQA